MLYSFSRSVFVAGRIELGKVIVVIQARLKSYRRDAGESNSWVDWLTKKLSRKGRNILLAEDISSLAATRT